MGYGRRSIKHISRWGRIILSTYLKQINKKETNEQLVSLRAFAETNKVPIIQEDGINFIIQVIKLRGIKEVLEIGTAIGYSAIRMALHTDVHITSIERNEEMYNHAIKNVSEANLQDKIDIIFNDALEVDEHTLNKVDLIFIDAAKAQSIKFFEKYEKLLTDKGIIITDNLLFHGLHEQTVRDRNLRQLLTKIDRFNKYVVEREEYDTYLYEIGDGMSLSVKRSD